jgi:hypothetical protein
LSVLAMTMGKPGEMLRNIVWLWGEKCNSHSLTHSLSLYRGTRVAQVQAIGNEGLWYSHCQGCGFQACRG